MRLLSWNVEDSKRAVLVLPEIVSELEKPDVVCFQELRIRASDHVALAPFTHALPGYTCHYALPRDPWANAYNASASRRLLLAKRHVHRVLRGDTAPRRQW